MNEEGNNEENGQLDEMEANRQNNLALKSGKEAFKRQAKKNARKEAVKAIIKAIIAKAVSILVHILLPSIIVTIFLVSIMVLILDGDASDASLNEEDMSSAQPVMTLAEYLAQFPHPKGSPAPQTEDGRFYKMYGDSVGWPTIGNADLQWKSQQDHFACQGKVLKSDGEYTVENVQEYVNSVLPRGGNATYTNAEIDALNIYIEKELVDQKGAEIAEGFYNYVLTQTEGLDLSQQQLYALTKVSYSGTFVKWNGYTFKEVYEQATALYAINSWEHNKYVWDNWFALVKITQPGHLRGRDAAFETYVKGIYDLSTSEAGFPRTTHFVYYTQEQIDYFENAYGKTVSMPTTRTPENEATIFQTKHVANAIVHTSDVATFALQFEGEGHSRFTSYTIPEGYKTFYGMDPSIGNDWCAMFVSYCYYHCGLIPDVLPHPFRGCGEYDIMKRDTTRCRDPKNYTPSSGDIIFFDWENDGKINHTGIVVDCVGMKVYTIEGNSGDSSTNPYWMGSKVTKHDERTINDREIVGYYSLADN